MLNKKIEKRKSKISGIGLFAKEKIHKGEIIWSPTSNSMRIIHVDEFSKLAKEEKQFWIDYCYQMDDHYYVDTDDARLMNHSCEPNVIDNPNDGAETIVAAGDIESDEEITWSYLPYMNPYLVFTCCCGSKNCVGVIRKGTMVRTV